VQHGDAADDERYVIECIPDESVRRWQRSTRRWRAGVIRLFFR